MDSRSAAHVLSQIGALLQVKGEQKFKARAYAGAARSLIALDTDDLAPLLRSGEPVKILGTGDVNAALRVTAHAFSASAREKITAAGGTVTTL